MKYFSGAIQLVMLLGLIGPCHADMYKYHDESGAVCITNSLDAVPKKFRKGMTVVKEDQPKQEKLLAPLPANVPAQKREGDPQVQKSEQQAAASAAVAQSMSRAKYVRTALIIVAMIGACFVMGRLTSSLGAPRMGTVLFLTVVLTGGVYLYGMYVQELRTVFNGLRKDALNVKRNVETREHKTESMLKEIQEQVKEPRDN